MPSFALSLLFCAAALFALGTIAAALRRAMPKLAGLRAQLAAADDRYELHFRVIETVVRVNDGKVVTLPIRPRPAHPLPQPGLRAAA